MMALAVCLAILGMILCLGGAVYERARRRRDAWISPAELNRHRIVAFDAPKERELW
jgi:hypothetical protein